MPGGYSQQLLDEIRSRADILEIVGQVVKLKRTGENWKGLCPFHSEKTPSFTVNPKRNIYHCFGCGAGGDAFSFLMRQERVAFPEAVRTLADRAGVALPDAGQRAPEVDGKLEALRRAMALAAEFYTRSLWEPGGEKARAYLEQRGVDPEVAKRFGLGYAPESWNALLGVMARQGIGEDVLVQAGLILARQNGPGFYDRFRGRLLFPIRDVQGRVVAFGGRALSGEEPKYLNSPETPLYVKGQILYALDVARIAMRERSRAIIVEGYLDCLMAHQHGFGETVAALGTAFTPAQLGLLRRYADEVVALFDADAAGQKASSRLEEMMNDVMDLQNLGWSVSRTGGFEKAGHLPIRVALLPRRPRPGQPAARRGRRRAHHAARRGASPALLRHGEGIRRRGPDHGAGPGQCPRPRGPDPLQGGQCRGGHRAGAGGRPAARRGLHPALDRGAAAAGLPRPGSPAGTAFPIGPRKRGIGFLAAARSVRAGSRGPPLASRRGAGRAPSRARG